MLGEPTFTLSFDIDTDEDIKAMPRTLDILDDFDIKAGFACTGKHIIERFSVFRKAIKDGHEIINHTQAHPDNFGKLSLNMQYEQILSFYGTAREYLNYTPKGFRVPHFGHYWSRELYGVMVKAGVQYSSSTIAHRCDHVIPYDYQHGRIKIKEFPLSPCPEHPHGILDTWHSLNRGVGKHANNFLETFNKLVDSAIKYNSYANVYFDPQDLTELMLVGICKKIVGSEINIKKYEDMLGD
jgi:hypothetical protein